MMETNVLCPPDRSSHSWFYLMKCVMFWWACQLWQSATSGGQYLDAPLIWFCVRLFHYMEVKGLIFWMRCNFHAKLSKGQSRNVSCFLIVISLYHGSLVHCQRNQNCLCDKFVKLSVADCLITNGCTNWNCTLAKEWNCYWNCFIFVVLHLLELFWLPVYYTRWTV